MHKFNQIRSDILKFGYSRARIEKTHDAFSEMGKDIDEERRTEWHCCESFDDEEYKQVPQKPWTHAYHDLDSRRNRKLFVCAE